MGMYEVGTNGLKNIGSASSAGEITYDNSESGLEASDVQGALDEVANALTDCTLLATINWSSGSTDVSADLSDNFENYKYVDIILTVTGGSYSHSKHHVIPTSLVKKNNLEFALNLYVSSSNNATTYVTLSATTISHSYASLVGWTDMAIELYGIK